MDVCARRTCPCSEKKVVGLVGCLLSLSFFPSTFFFGGVKKKLSLQGLLLSNKLEAEPRKKKVDTRDDTLVFLAHSCNMSAGGLSRLISVSFTLTLGRGCTTERAGAKKKKNGDIGFSDPMVGMVEGHLFGRNRFALGGGTEPPTDS